MKTLFVISTTQPQRIFGRYYGIFFDAVYYQAACRINQFAVIGNIFLCSAHYQDSLSLSSEQPKRIATELDASRLILRDTMPFYS